MDKKNAIINRIKRTEIKSLFCPLIDIYEKELDTTSLIRITLTFHVNTIEFAAYLRRIFIPRLIFLL